MKVFIVSLLIVVVIIGIMSSGKSKEVHNVKKLSINCLNKDTKACDKLDELYLQPIEKSQDKKNKAN